MAGTLVAGQDYTVLNPIIYWAFRGTPLPSPSLQYQGVWPAGWKEIRDTVNGLQVTCRNPKTAVTGERFGRLGQLPSGDDGIAIAVQNLTPEMDFLQLVSSMMKKEVAAANASAILTITGNVTTASNVTVTLGGVATPVAVAVGDTATQVATKIVQAYTSITAWTATRVGSVVTFTATSSAAVSGANAYSSGGTGANGTIVFTQSQKAFTSRYLSKMADNQFMLGWEGVALAGGLFSEDRIVRGVAYRVENTANADHVWRWTGADATVRPNTTLECLPENPGAFNLEGSGVPIAALDPARKFNYFDSLIAA